MLTIHEKQSFQKLTELKEEKKFTKASVQITANKFLEWFATRKTHKFIIQWSLFGFNEGEKLDYYKQCSRH